MTDTSHSSAVPTSSLYAHDARTKKRNAAEARFKAYGMVAIAIGLIMLVTLMVTIFGKGLGAFQQTFITMNVELLESKLDKSGTRDLEKMSAPLAMHQLSKVPSRPPLTPKASRRRLRPKIWQSCCPSPRRLNSETS